MKTTLALLTLVFSFAVTAKTITVEATSIQKLSVKESQVTLLLPYPGAELSGLCGIELRTTYGDVNRLMGEIEINRPATVLNPHAIEIDLSAHSGMYLAISAVTSKSGAPLAEVIKKALYGGEVYLVATSCR